MSNPPSSTWRDQFDPGWREREAAARKKILDAVPTMPECLAGGMPYPGGMCPQIIVGGKLCGFDGWCPHKEQPSAPEKERP
jgi:hypothetical protein